MTDRSVHDDSGEESYFVSMTDMMVGLLFIFIIMLMYFAFSYREQESSYLEQELEKARIADDLESLRKKLEEDKKRIETRATTSAETRGRILTDIRSALEQKGVSVVIDLQNGILRLPEKILFDPGSAALGAAARNNVMTLAATLTEILPCYTHLAPGSPARRRSCPSETPHRIEAIFVEGHTDTDPYAAGAGRDNWNLSVERAVATYRALMEHQNGVLGTLLSAPLLRPGSAPVFSVSGYADTRLANPADTPIEPDDPPEVKESKRAAKADNRRIDLRFIMASPAQDLIRDIDRALGQ